MRTQHRVITGDAVDLGALEDASHDLVVTSPPYPMIEMWDDFFLERSPDVEAAYENGEARRVFELMHEELNRVWTAVDRVLKPSGIVCVNIGDATRKFDDVFELFPNHVEVTRHFQSMGYESLPGILWRKPTNSSTKFLGSGMIPPNAYVTLEHEHVLVFRKPRGPRRTEPGDPRRYESGYFWEERNLWFSDLWEDVTGISQDLDNEGLRQRAAAYPLTIPYRLINMFSLQSDRILDPFLGTGTTTLAAIMAGRSSTGIELQEAFVDHLDRRVEGLEDLTGSMNERRFERHRTFLEDREPEELPYENETYGTPVKTKQERSLRLLVPESVGTNDDGYAVDHRTWFPDSTTEEPSRG